MKKIEIIT